MIRQFLHDICFAYFDGYDKIKIGYEKIKGIVRRQKTAMKTWSSAGIAGCVISANKDTDYRGCSIEQRPEEYIWRFILMDYCH
jgi:hypothetical protein